MMEKIVGLTHDLPACDHKINGTGLISIPGPIDTHVHYGVYSSIDKAAKTESHAAAIGGITTMMSMDVYPYRHDLCLHQDSCKF